MRVEDGVFIMRDGAWEMQYVKRLAYYACARSPTLNKGACAGILQPSTNMRSGFMDCWTTTPCSVRVVQEAIVDRCRPMLRSDLFAAWPECTGSPEPSARPSSVALRVCRPAALAVLRQLELVLVLAPRLGPLALEAAVSFLS
eukprot:6188720-Pleurochrysis_carterae.AAC.1